MMLQLGQQPQTHTDREINPATGRPYRARTWRARLAAVRLAGRRGLLDDQTRAAEDRAQDRNRLRRANRALDIIEGRIGAGRAPLHLDDPAPTVLAVTAEDRKVRDRSLRGKDRIRARKAARRAGATA